MKKAKLKPVEEVDAVQLHDVNVHWLELAILAGEEPMKKARLLEPVDDVNAVQLHDANVYWLELAILAGEDCM